MDLDTFFNYNAEEDLAVVAADEEAPFAEFPPEIYSLTAPLEGQLYQSLEALVRAINITINSYVSRYYLIGGGGG